MPVNNSVDVELRDTLSQTRVSILISGMVLTAFITSPG